MDLAKPICEICGCIPINDPHIGASETKQTY
jgi:hypothetical protein